MDNLILGTASFRNGYGVANKFIEYDVESVREIIETAQKFGIKRFDTAPSYGLAQRYLGEYLDHKLKPKISSKISSFDASTPKLILESVVSTLSQTKADKIENLYLHDAESLTGANGSQTMAGLTQVLSLDLVERIGLSVYNLDELLRAKELFPQLTVFQVPENICDRRLWKSQELIELHQEGNHFVIRSVFLQGLLLMVSEQIPSGLKKANKTLSQILTFASNCGVLPLDLCLAYAKSIPWANGIIIGVANKSQLQQIIESDFNLPSRWESKINTLPHEILDPRQW